ncbi:MAG TPA: thioredoxin domain-containing protein [Solirubrobacteraceae bacterium]|nr:thioredoxin domain-containing protein [Solirubrobacteraceae bacterium]
MSNRLASETSPYLLQHAENPVDWYPWSDEALSRARSENKPILVSIGYAACHWCHVMERESFEDPSVAELMNERFVCIKVDREERPDVDAIYMDAVQAMTGHGGWPLNAFLTPEGVPYYAGTYFPPEPRQGMPSWPQVVVGVATAWEEQREEIEETGRQILPRLAGAASMAPAEGEPDPAGLDAAVQVLRRGYDHERGGFSANAPKFPAASTIEFLLRRGERQMALHTLRAMATGGMYDQIGGGFARYSVDARWEIPHFEKMLYDNALLARAYLHGFQVSGEPFFARVCTETLDWALRDLRQEEGGFASALDADSEGEEGRFYVWTPDAMRAALRDEDSARIEAALAYFGLTGPPNFEGSWAPVRATTDPEGLSEIKARLRAVRERRVWPALDDKRLTAWNALMISALADAGAALERPDYTDAAVACAEFVWREMRDDDGRLLRTYNRGQARLGAYLEDHAFLLEALLTLYETTFDPRWFAAARDLADTILARFSDPENGGFFATADDHEPLIARRKELEDAPIPAGASSAAFGLLRLAALTGEHGYEEAALGVLRLLHVVAPQHPAAFGHLLQALDFHFAAVKEVAIVGPDAAPLERVVRGEFRPHLVVAGGVPDGVPLLDGREPVDGRAAAYVCERFACLRPVTEPHELAALL